MKKGLLFSAVVFALTLCMPVVAQADDKIISTVTTAQFEELLKNVTDTTTKFTTTIVNIRKEPNVESEILGQTMTNTTVEVILEIDGWSMILTEDGYAYLKSEYLSDEKTTYNYTENDLYIMAHVICGEAQSYSDEEQRYVGSVVLNRVKHEGFPNSIEEVVFQTKPSLQYACTKDGNYYREPTERNWANAQWLLENGSVFPDFVIWQSRGKQGKGVYLKTEVHYYCY